MAVLGRTEGRLAFSIVLTAVIPLIVSIYFASTLVDRAFEQAFTPELGAHLDQALGVYQDLAKAVKEGMRSEADAIAAGEPLRAAAALHHDALMREQLAAVFLHHPHLFSLGIADGDNNLLAFLDRGRALDESQEAKLEVRRPLGDSDVSPSLIAVFVTPRARFDELSKTSEFVRAYHQIEGARVKLKRGDLYAFAAILAATIVVAVGLGTLLARSVTTRLSVLAEATQAVAAGNLGVRVPEQGKDELADLSRGFNRMLSEVEKSRARIEFLQQMGTWQEMARRLAHEIKNPLTPILLAVEECHRKYGDKDPAFRKLLDTTLEIVEEEVGTLRRLVHEFSSFARLPRAELTEADLGEFLREQADRMSRLEDDGGEIDGGLGRDEGELARSVAVTWKIPDEPMPAALDRQMLRRVLVNILRNAAQAIRADKGSGRVAVTVERQGEVYAIRIDDDGPGVAVPLRASIFDPYVTTKADGTGLGLSIVKKIVVEHGGSIDVERSSMGGASFRVRIPTLTSAAAQAARDVKGKADAFEAPGANLRASGA